jgi:RNA-directed DNA polymerase
MNSSRKAKQFTITKREIYQAWLHVRSNAGASGVDGESIASFEAKLSKNLYKLWNRMSSGSYFPKAVKRVEIPKKDGGVRSLGIPTVSDRIAQEVVRMRLEPLLEPKFHENSYGYRPGKSGIDAVRTCRERNWKYDWVLDVDIQKFFDSIDHELLLKAVAIHCHEKWMMLYIERWLKTMIKHPDGREEACTCGTPQGGVVSPLLANIFLHYAFDKWIEREFPLVKFERYADDVVIHCSSENESREVCERLKERLLECGLKLHPEKTKLVYCKDGKRKADYPVIGYTFLGYTFQPRSARSWDDRLVLGYLPFYLNKINTLFFGYFNLYRTIPVPELFLRWLNLLVGRMCRG